MNSLLGHRTRRVYAAVLDHLKARGLRMDAYAMGVATDIALAVERGDQKEAQRLARRIRFDLRSLEVT